MRKKILSLCMALALCLSLLPATALAAGEHDSHSDGWTELTADTTTLSGGSYYLSGDVEYSGTESITVSGEVILCLNDHKLDLKGQHISVGSGASLTLCDCSTGGVLTGGSDSARNGGGVYVAGGGTFTLTGGNITGNTAAAGGGVYVDEGGTFTMAGGSINNNKATSGGGGGVMVNLGTFTLSGGSITGNATNDETYGFGGGVCLYGTFYLSGDSIIQNNTKAGATDNLYLGWNTIKITGPLGENARIGVNAEGVPRSFISGWSDNMAGENPADYFSSDGDDGGIGLNTAGDVVLGSQSTTITLEPNGGTLPEYSLVEGAALPIPSKTGYTFAGWYENPEFNGNPVTDIPTDSTGELTFYAKWTVNTYTVTFDANGGTINSGEVTSYTYGVGATLPTDVTRSGYAFAGWYEQSDFSGSKVTEITDTDMGDKTYYAKWLSTDAGVISVSVNGVTGNISGDQITVTLPPNSALPDGIEDIAITPAAGAASSNLTISTGAESVTYTFTVTAEDGQTTANYTVIVTVADDPAAGNKADVDAAKTAIERHTWTVPQATANTEEAVKAWIEGQLAGMNLNGASYTVTMTGFTAAVKGTSADRDGTDGSFAFTVVLSKGTATGDAFTSTYAEATATVTGGTIIATAYTGGGGGGSSRPTPSLSDRAIDDIQDARPGDTVEITLRPGRTTLEREVFEELAGQDITLEIDAGDGVLWTVNGLDIPEDTRLHDLDLDVDLGDSGIPATVLNAVTGEISTVQLSLAHDGEFGFTMTLSAPLGRDNADYWANLYWYNEETEELEFQQAARIARDGTAEFALDHASDYAIVIDDRSHEPVDLPFNDVPEGYWAYDAIQYVYGEGLMAGTGETTFSPSGTTTRGQIVTILWRLAGSPQVNYLMDFSDVDPAAWYGEAVRWASSLRIASGYGDGRFGPNDPITREQMAVMLHRYAQHQGCDVSIGEDTNILSYADAFTVSEYAVSALQWACGAGIISGTGDGSTLTPQGEATRAQAAVMLERFCNMYGNP